MSEGVRKIFIAGATSELGNRVADGLVNNFGAGRISCLVRDTSAPEAVAFLDRLGVKLVTGDVLKPETMAPHLDHQTLYIDMTHPKYYAQTIEPITNAGVQRVIFITTTGLFSQYNQCSGVYVEGEERIRQSGLTYTIMRPSMIYGTFRDRNMTRLLRYLNTYPLFPVFGDGSALMQPVYVQDLADGICAAVNREEISRSKEYNLCGPKPMPYIDLIRTACAALGRRVRIIHVPYRAALSMVTAASLLPVFPISREQVMRLVEDKCFDISLAEKELDYRPRWFVDGIRLEIEHLRERGIIK